jgi:hypothetical protein
LFLFILFFHVFIFILRFCCSVRDIFLFRFCFISWLCLFSKKDFFFLNCCQYEHYLDFLNWGDSGTDDIFTNFTESAMKLAYGNDIKSEAGWDNLCPYSLTMQFIGGKYDEEHCSVNDRDSYLQGCAPGFYQPMLDIAKSPKACPDGFFCPENFACTLLCMPGSQCHNSTVRVHDGRCSFPKVMHDAKIVNPLAITVDPNDAASETELVCPGAGNLFLCEGGYYCPTAVTVFECSKGNFCPVGSIKEKPCSFLGDCPEGASAPDYQEGVYFTCLMILLGFVLSLKIFRRVRRHLREKRISRRKAEIDKKKLLKSQQHMQKQLNPTKSTSTSRRGGGVGGKGVLSIDPLSGKEDEYDDTASERESEPSSPRSAGVPVLSSLRDKRDTMLDLTFIRLGLELRSSNVKVLNAVTGACRPGRVTAIMVRMTIINTMCTLHPPPPPSPPPPPHGFCSCIF